MWWGTEPDPGGSNPSEPTASSSEVDPTTLTAQELSDLKDQSEQQQKLITQLKEMLRKTDQIATTASLEKAEKLTSTLSKMQMRAKRNKQKKLLEVEDEKILQSKCNIDSPGKEKVNLLKKQLEENRAKLAERDKHQKGIEDKVTQIRAQLDDSQAIFNQSLTLVSQRDSKPTIPVKTYSAESTNEELLAVISDKDKEINDLNSKVQELQANVLDLQENLKEKDSVIDARTKAITLMSEDLSRRGKTTLDMLDETKEQMRLMQEKFVLLECEMKEEKEKLLAELETKQTIIQQLEEKNNEMDTKYHKLEVNVTTLKDENEKLLHETTTKKSQIEQLEKQLKESTVKEKKGKRGRNKSVDSELQSLRDENSKLLKKIDELTAQSNTVEEVEKLTKQLDDMNKSMIKLKAQSKSKQKELQKQLDVFKKGSDVNSELVKLNAENSKLKQQVANLEEEKSKLQINLVDYNKDKVTETDNEMIIEDLQDKLKQLQTEIAERNKELKEISDAKHHLADELEKRSSEMISLNNRVMQLSQIEEEQVKTQVNSAELEEQIDELQTKNKDLTQQVSTISKENISLHDRIEQILNEKHELNTKLDNLIHENMDLIDRLEKLSAEKVSSAESIEIVEALTQQEKLEIEEYNQKYIEPDPIEAIQELEPSNELNDSVAKLTEESAELMEKIELFTIERKEVMEKMEHLTSENNLLIEKVKVLEQEKLQLEETYELLFDEKTKIDMEVDELKTKLSKTDSSLEADNKNDTTIENEIEKYTKLVEDQKIQINELKRLLKEKEDVCNDLGVEKSTIEIALQEVQKEKDVISTELCSLKETYSDNQIKLDELIKDNLQYKQQIETSTSEISSLKAIIDTNNEELNAANEKLKQYQLIETEAESLQAEIYKLTELLTENSSKITEYEQVINQNTILIDELKDELSQLQESLLEAQNLLTTREEHIHRLEDENNQLHAKCEDKNKQIEKIVLEFQDKYRKLESKIESNTESLDDIRKPLIDQIQTLEERCKVAEHKNEEQLQKMKKVAAHLKKKSSAYDELEKEMTAMKVILDSISAEKDNYIKHVENMSIQINELENKLQTVNQEADHYKQECLSLSNQIEILQKSVNENVDTINLLSVDNETKTNALHETKQQLESQKQNADVYLAKYQEQEMVIENLQQEQQHYTERIVQLEEIVQTLRNEKQSLENTIETISNELDFKTSSLNNSLDNVRRIQEEIIQLESQIVTLNRRIQEIEIENEELQSQNQKSNENVHTLQQQLNTIEQNYRTKTNDEVEKLETVVNKLTLDLNETEMELKRVQSELKQEFINRQQEIEKLEMESSLQCEEFNTERKRLLEQIEHHCQELNRLNNQHEEQLAEIEQLKSTIQSNEQFISNEESEEIQKIKAILHQQETQYHTLSEQFNSNEAYYQTLIDQLQQEIQELRLFNQKTEERGTNFEQENKILKTQLETFNTESVIQSVKVTQLQMEENEMRDMKERIKALQFMLHNSEKSKDDAVNICQELLNELTRREYENKSVSTNIEQPTKNLDEKIASTIMQSVESEIICNSIDSGIPSEERPFEKYFPPVQSEFPIEENITCKKAYKCFDEDKTTPLELDMEENLWGTEEAVLEEMHMQSTATSLQTSEALTNLQEKVSKLEIESEQHLSEIKNLQVTRNKLIKKLKEYKEKNEQLTKQIKGNSFGELDMAIEEELKSQITTLEKKLSEITAEKEKEHLEREGLLRRIDVLTTANERMLEMKEKQDIELQICQAKNRELSEKMLEWNDDFFETKDSNKQEPIKVESSNSSVTELQKQIEELNAKIKDLSIDNEELQCMLEEQLELKNEALKQLSERSSDLNIRQLQEDYNVIVSEKNKLQNELQQIIEDKSVLEAQLNELKQNTITSSIKSSPEYLQLLQQLTSTQNEEKAYSEKLQTIIKEKDLLVESENTLKEQIIELQAINDKFKIENTSLSQNLKELTEHTKLTENQLQELMEQTHLLQKSNDDIIQLQLENNHFKERLHQLEQQAVVSNNAEKSNDELRQLQLLVEQYVQEINCLKEQIDQERFAAEEKFNTALIEWSAELDKRGASVAESWKLHLESRESEFQEIETQLRAEIQNMEVKYNSLLENKTDNEIQNAESSHENRLNKQKIIDLEEQVINYEQKLKQKTDEIEILQGQLMFCRNEMESLNVLIENKEAQIQQMIHETAQLKEKLLRVESKYNDISEMNGLIIAEKDQLSENVEKIKQTLIENEILVQNLNIAIKMKDEELLSLKEEILCKEKELQCIDELSASLQNKDIEISQLKEEYNTKSNELIQIDQLKNEIISLQNMLSDIEMKNKQLELEITARDEKVDSLNEIINIKTKEIENLNIQLQSQQSAIDRINEKIQSHICPVQDFKQELDVTNVKMQLESKNAECNELQSKIDELNYMINEDTKQMSDLKDIIENQVLKIEELKKISSKADEEKPTTSVTEKHVHFSDDDSQLVVQHYYEPSIESEDKDSSLEVGDDIDESNLETEPVTMVNRAELEVALYMLHQRDVRCEELTVELMQLLEERDTLQLRLSNAIRMNEELRRKISPRKSTDEIPVEAAVTASSVAATASHPEGTDSASEVLSNTPRQSKSSEILLGATGAEIAKEATEDQELSPPLEDKTYLENKISELHSVDYRRDVRLKDESQVRHMQQLSLIQQHRDLAMLPPEATARLVDANYTLSRESESASTVLLNWLWGRSTPKVNHL